MDAESIIEVSNIYMMNGLLEALESIADPQDPDFDSHVRARDALKAFDEGKSANQLLAKASVQRIGAALKRTVKEEQRRRCGP